MKNPSFLHSIVIVSFFALSGWQGAKPFFVIYPVDLPPSHFTPSLLMLRRTFHWTKTDNFCLFIILENPIPHPREHSVPFSSCLSYGPVAWFIAICISLPFESCGFDHCFKPGFQKEYHQEGIYVPIASPKISHDSCPDGGGNSISPNGVVIVWLSCKDPWTHDGGVRHLRPCMS